MSVTLNASTSSGLVQTADTSGQIELQSNGTTKLSVLSTGVSGTLVQGTAVASTSGTSIDFTSIPSWVKKITVMLNGVSTNGTSFVCCKLGVGTDFQSGSYKAANLGTNGTGITTGNANTNEFALSTNATAADLRYGQAIISNMGNNIWTFSCITTNGGAGNLSYSSGALSMNGTLDRVRITTITGTDTFDAGSINIQYEG